MFAKPGDSMRNDPPRKRARGFTLIELMVAVAVVAILTAVAYPSYIGHLVKTRRALAQAALEIGRGAMERFYTERYTYLNAAGAAPIGASPPCIAVIATATDTGAAPCIFASNSGASDYYTLTIGAASAATYTLRATPRSGSSQAADHALELDNTGKRGWDKNDDGDTLDANETGW
jgi:type IV pilus assembly protein PilE